MNLIITILAYAASAYLSGIDKNSTQVGNNSQRLFYEENQPPLLVKSNSSAKFITPDLFEINDTQFEKFKSGKYENWFVTKDRTARLYFVPYTDYSITTAILTESDKLPKDITGLFNSEGIQYRAADKAILSENFVSKKGFKLGVTSGFAINIYGKPNVKKKTGDLETLTWNFQMKEPGTYKSGSLTPIIVDGLAFDVELTFKKDRLHTLVYRYEVP
jgi:hypothetical protein